MVLGFGQKGGKEDVAGLIAKKSYGKAIELIKGQLKSQRSDPRLRMQLADVLALAGKGREAVMILTPLADEFAREGFAAKAIAVLKKIQKIDPERRDVEAKLAGLIQEKQQQATVSAPPAAPSLEIGMEEIGFEPPAGGPVTVPAAKASAPQIGMELEAEHEPAPVPEPPPRTGRPAGPVEDRDLVIEEAGIELEPVVEPEPAPPAPSPQERPVVVVDEPEPSVAEVEPELTLEPEAEEALPVTAEAAEPEFALDDAEEFQLDEETPPTDAEVEVEEPAAEEAAGEPISAELFVDELMSVLEDAFPSGLEAPLGEPVQPAGGGAQIVVSPLFRHFSVDEMVAVIAGLNLLSFERGQVIIREGEPGHSLFMLSSGRVKAFQKQGGRQVPIATLDEGAFFGEGSILTGKPRTASVVALTQCELLELDRATLDSIVEQHPHVMDVLREFAAQRSVGK